MEPEQPMAVLEITPTAERNNSSQGTTLILNVERGFGGTSQSRHEALERGLKFRKSVYWHV